MGVGVSVGMGVSVAGTLVEVLVASLVGMLFNCLLPPQPQHSTIPIMESNKDVFFIQILPI
jgi:hypothetical protein